MQHCDGKAMSEWFASPEGQLEFQALLDASASEEELRARIVGESGVRQRLRREMSAAHRCPRMSFGRLDRAPCSEHMSFSVDTRLALTFCSNALCKRWVPSPSIVKWTTGSDGLSKATQCTRNMPGGPAHGNRISIPAGSRLLGTKRAVEEPRPPTSTHKRMCHPQDLQVFPEDQCLRLRGMLDMDALVTIANRDVRHVELAMRRGKGSASPWDVTAQPVPDVFWEAMPDLSTLLVREKDCVSDAILRAVHLCPNLRHLAFGCPGMHALPVELDGLTELTRCRGLVSVEAFQVVQHASPISEDVQWNAFFNVLRALPTLSYVCMHADDTSLTPRQLAMFAEQPGEFAGTLSLFVRVVKGRVDVSGSASWNGSHVVLEQLSETHGFTLEVRVLNSA
mmetsp:Transcript_23748/g.64406  ORF Transcript_23748/g.64406 Transcript_23748/m.64406 type:complete len:395 (+) Transcript_23748:77-1261(+)